MKIELKFLALKIPPLLLMLIFAALIWLNQSTKFILPTPTWLNITMCGLFVAIGIYFMLAGVWAFKKANTTVDPTKPQSSKSLVVTGVYRYTRNPMYVGFSACLIALCAYLAAPLLLSFVAAFVLYLNHFQIAPEEQILMNIFGKPYQDYCQRVRRWL